MQIPGLLGAQVGNRSPVNLYKQPAPKTMQREEEVTVASALRILGDPWLRLERRVMPPKKLKALKALLDKASRERKKTVGEILRDE